LEIGVIAESEHAFFDFIVMVQVPHLVTTDLGELHAVLALIHLKNSHADLSLKSLLALVFGDEGKLHFVFVLAHERLHVLALDLLHQCRLDHVWVVSREKVGVVGKYVAVRVKLFQNRKVLHRDYLVHLNVAFSVY